MPFLERHRLERCTELLRLVALRITAIVLQIAAQLLLGRLLGSAGLGLFQLVSTWLNVLGETAAMGLPSRAMRTVSSSKDGETIAQYRFLIKTLLVICASWALLAGVTIGVYYYAPNFLPFDTDARQMSYLWVVLFGALGFAQLRLIAEVLKAQQHAQAAVFAESAGPVAVLLVGIGICTWLGVSDALQLALIYVVGFAFTASVLIGIFVVPNLISILSRSTEHGNSLELRMDTDLAALASSGLLNILFVSFPFIVLPYVSSLREIGTFSVAFKLVNLISTILLLLSALYGPKFAKAAKNGEAHCLADILRRTQLVSCLLYLPPLLVLALFSEDILLLFGEEFVVAKPYIYALLVGQAINAATGLSGVMLNMVGAGKHELLCSFSAISIASLIALMMHNTMTTLDVAILFSAALAFKNLASYGCAVLYIRNLSTVRAMSPLPMQTT
ncbi:MAG: hypothetical protein AAF542_17170 [Pseudomonadota bacterium]